MTIDEATQVVKSYKHLHKMKCALKHSYLRVENFVEKVEPVPVNVEANEFEVHVVLKPINSSEEHKVEIRTFLDKYIQTY